MNEINTHAGNLRLVGGRLCLDFVNTANNHGLACMKEHLTDYAALLAWARHADALSDAETDQLRALAHAQPDNALDTLVRARRLRQALYYLFGTLGAPHRAAEELAALNAELARLPRAPHLLTAQTGPRWDWGAPEQLDRMLYPVAWSAAELLTASERALVRECAGQGCTWLFLDTSRNHSRRWCSMDDCGNRAKAQRHYARHRQRDTNSA